MIEIQTSLLVSCFKIQFLFGPALNLKDTRVKFRDLPTQFFFISTPICTHQVPTFSTWVKYTILIYILQQPHSFQ